MIPSICIWYKEVDKNRDFWVTLDPGRPGTSLGPSLVRGAPVFLGEYVTWPVSERVLPLARFGGPKCYPRFSIFSSQVQVSSASLGAPALARTTPLR